MIGEGMLLTCLQQTEISEILMVNRRHSPIRHPKLSELIVQDFTDLSSYTEQLTGYDACIYCAGISSFGMNESQYSHITFDTTMAFAETLSALNPQMTFFYLSGVYADSSAKGRIMWARVKGKTENALARLPFKKVYSFRPGFIIPLAAQNNTRMLYKVLNLIYPIIFPKQTLTYGEIVRALLHIFKTGYSRNTLEIRDLKIASGKK